MDLNENPVKATDTDGNKIFLTIVNCVFNLQNAMFNVAQIIIGSGKIVASHICSLNKLFSGCWTNYVMKYYGGSLLCFGVFQAMRNNC